VRYLFSRQFSERVNPKHNNAGTRTTLSNIAKWFFQRFQTISAELIFRHLDALDTKFNELRERSSWTKCVGVDAEGQGRRPSHGRFVGDKWKDSTEFTIISMRACGGSEVHTAGHLPGLKPGCGAALSQRQRRAGWDAVDPKYVDVTSMPVTLSAFSFDPGAEHFGTW